MNGRAAMIRRQIALLLSLFAPLELPTQRYGRPDAIQIYGRVEPVLLHVKVEKKRSSFRCSDLRKKPRVHFTFTHPSTGQAHTYEGVNLEDLLPAGILSSESAIVEISFASHQTRAITEF
jgi:hypothetical protein